MFRERFAKVREELVGIATALTSLADRHEPLVEDNQLLASSMRSLCLILVRVIDSLP